MGIFKRLFKGFNKQRALDDAVKNINEERALKQYPAERVDEPHPETSRESVDTAKEIAKAAHGRTIDIDGDCETKIYTYLGVVFKGMKVGESRYVNVVDHDITLHSRSTGTEIDTAEWESTALSYQGRAFGSLGGRLGFLKDAAASGYVKRIKVRKTGMHSAGIPELVALTVNSRVLEMWWERQRASVEPVPFDANAFEMQLEEQGQRRRLETISRRVGIPITEASATAWFYPTEKTWLDGVMPPESKTIIPKFKILEPTEGSHAKPHILVMDGDHPVYEASARSAKAYATVMENIGRPCRGRIIRDYYGDGADDTRIVLVFE